MQDPKPSKTGLPGTPQKAGPRSARQLKATPSELDSASPSSQAHRTPKGRTPKVLERRSPRSPVIEKRKPTRVSESELESQLSLLRKDLKRTKDQLVASESFRNQVQQDSEDSKKELSAISLKLQESQKQVQALSAFEKSALNEIQRLRFELETIAESEATQTKLAESAQYEIQRLKEYMEESDSLIGNMESELKDCKESEAQAQALANDTLLQLEAAKSTIETLRTDGIKETQRKEHLNRLELELNSMNLEIGQLRCSLETAEIRSNEERIHAYDLVEEIKSTSSLREAELEAESNNLKAEIKELKANLRDNKSFSLERECELERKLKESEVNIADLKAETKNLKAKIQELKASLMDKSFSLERERELETELKDFGGAIADLRADLMDKETELQNIVEENENLITEIKKMEINKCRSCEDARASEAEALKKLNSAMEEAEKTRRRVSEQLEASQAVNSEMELELRKMKVQSDQWRKAAEAAAAMIAASNNEKLLERTVSVDSNDNESTVKNISPCFDYDSTKRRNGNVLKKIGVLWKKPQN